MLNLAAPGKDSECNPGQTLGLTANDKMRYEPDGAAHLLLVILNIQPAYPVNCKPLLPVNAGTFGLYMAAT